MTKLPWRWWCSDWYVAPLCTLDILTRCKVPVICRWHDRAVSWAADRWAAREDRKTGGSET